MYKLTFLLLLSLVFSLAFAAKSNEASFNIQEKEDKILVIAEIPWSIDKALVQFNPELTDSSNQAYYDNTLFEYIRYSLVLLDENRDTIKLESVVKDDYIADSIVGSYVFQFAKSEIYIIRNSVLFNINEDQKNQHVVYRGALPISFISTKEQVDYYVEKPFNKRFYLLALPVLILPLYFVYRRVRRNNRKYRKKIKNPDSYQEEN